jgi:glycosyltransferase involved in cell wall biosynthesis
MTICFIAPGEISIPPISWGALEAATWFLSFELQKLGFETFIVNEKDPNLVYQKVKEINPDVIHLNYGHHYEIMPYFSCRKIVTSYDGSFKSSLAFHDSLVRRFFYDCEFFCITNFEKQFLIKVGVSPKKIKVLPSGAKTDAFRVCPAAEAKKYNQTICIGKIDERKAQFKLQNRDLDIDFVGEIATSKFDATDSYYLGTWTREQVYNNMTDYGNFILLSTSELQPFVCMEAISAGLGLVISEACTEHLDLSLPFISVIPNNKLEDYKFIKEALIKNSDICYKMRKEIVQYAVNFNWRQIALKYEEYIHEK